MTTAGHLSVQPPRASFQFLISDLACRPPRAYQSNQSAPFPIAMLLSSATPTPTPTHTFPFPSPSPFHSFRPPHNPLVICCTTLGATLSSASAVLRHFAPASSRKGASAHCLAN
ncbi:hypothetical protein BCV70DRAFT_828 [Testicularia cyperi]|uniref:Uncharacterized protein n=1 Tax=Testicularia cyperi TaxID=1882483 RepID=A0A317XWJ8_9BASI|nr:hypothetical protein BCV70DRAFT_828 [Testicularia cyperi]